MYLKLLILNLILVSILFSESTEKNISIEPESKLNEPKTVEKKATEIKNPVELNEKQIPEKKLEKPEKKFSISASFGTGFGNLGIQLSQRDPTYSPQEFVFTSIFAVSLISTNTSNNLAGNLNPTSFLNFLVLNESLKKEIYNANSNSIYNRFYLMNKTKSEDSGFQMGLSSGYYAFQTDSSRDALSFLPLALFPNNSPLINQFAAISYNQSRIPIYTNITTFDFFFSKHFIPNDHLDFYLAFGGGIGGCLIECKAVKLSPKLGAKYFFDEEIFLFLESELNYLILFDTERKYSPLIEKAFTFGFGTYL